MKKSIYSSLSLGLAAVVAALALPVVQAQENDREMRTRNRNNYEVLVGDYYTGRSPYFRGSPKAEPVVQVAQAKPAPAPRSAAPCSTVAVAGPVTLSKTAPTEAVLNEPFTYELKATATACAGNVIARTPFRTASPWSAQSLRRASAAPS